MQEVSKKVMYYPSKKVFQVGKIFIGCTDIQNQQKGKKNSLQYRWKICTIVGALKREPGWKHSLEALCRHIDKLKQYQQFIRLQQEDKDKIYSLHEPNVKCYIKGKEHKKHEFGSKASIVAN